MKIDRNGLEILGRDECVRLLKTATLGRIGVQARALPVVLPVNFLVDGDQIVIRTGRGTKLDAATSDAVVAFETDDIDAMYHTGWSVTVTGVAREIVAAGEVERLRTLPLAHWAPGEAERFVAISMDFVSGRRISRDALAAT